MKTGWEKYKNPDPRCDYPFTPESLGYCWSYAHHVDATSGYEDIESICKRSPCEFWKEKGATGAVKD